MSEVETMRTALMTGGCQCGALRYAIYEKPTRVGICHCRMCQKAVGGPFGVYAVVRLGDFRWTRGQPASWASSNCATRDFCARCGTPLDYRPNTGATIELLTGTLDRPELAAPTYAVGTEGMLAWLGELSRLPGKSTTESIGSPEAASVISNQHPDHDTGGAKA
jgi:hypothetical protein